MSQVNIDRTRIPLLQLVWPIFIENILRTALMSVDTLMLSRYSAKAVAAMSLVNQFSFFIVLVYMMVAVGASILISQNLGAGKPREAGLVGVGSLVLVMVVGVLVSALTFFGIGFIISRYALDPEVALYARQFMMIYGGFSFFIAFNIGQASIVRAWGYTREPMLVNVLAIVLTVIGNAICLFGPFGLPVLGVPGVAAANVFAQMVACAFYYGMIKRKKDIELPLGELRRIPRRVYKAVLAVGVPTAGENLSYNISQIAILTMIAHMGTDALTAYGVVLAVLRYVFMPGICIGMGAQIKVGYYVGAARYQEAARRVYYYLAAGIAISVVLIFGIALTQEWLWRLFSKDPEVLALCVAVYFVAQIHEPARNFNTVVIPALKGAGDVRFPVYVGMASMWGLGVGGAWLLGVRMGYGLVGIWIAMAADEWVRGLIMVGRWRSGAWKNKALVSSIEGESAAAVTLSAVEQSEGI